MVLTEPVSKLVRVGRRVYRLSEFFHEVDANFNATCSFGGNCCFNILSHVWFEVVLFGQAAPSNTLTARRFTEADSDMQTKVTRLYAVTVVIVIFLD